METVRSLVSTMRSPLGRQTTEGGHRAVAAAGRRPMRRGMAVVVTVCAVHSLSSRAFRPLLAAAAAQADGDFGMCASRGSQLCAGAARSATSSVPDVEKTSLWKDVEVETPEALQAVVDNLLGSGKNRVLIKFWAPWCPACRKVAPELERLAAEMSDEPVSFFQINADGAQAIMQQFKISRIPHALVFERTNPDTPRKFPLNPGALSATQPGLDALWTLLETTPACLEARCEDDDEEPAFPGDNSVPGVSAAAVSAAAPHAGAGARLASYGDPRVAPRAPAPLPTAASPGSPGSPGYPTEEYPGYGYGMGEKAFHDMVGREIQQRLGYGQAYLDYTGAALPATSVLEASFEELRQNAFGNPHTNSPSSRRADMRVEQMRLRVLRFFGATAGEYQCIFTAGTTASLHLVGEAFPWSAESRFTYLRPSHTSLLGVREYALERGGSAAILDEEEVEAWGKGAEPRTVFRRATSGATSASTSTSTSTTATGAGAAGASSPSAAAAAAPAHAVAAAAEGEEGGEGEPAPPRTYHLFGFPGEENYSGLKYPLKKFVAAAHARSTPAERTLVVLDAAAFASTAKLDLSESKPDFVAVSFYKIFGYPTGLGALLMRTEHVDVMTKRYWGGGTTSMAGAASDWKALKCRPPDRFEDGTTHFLGVAALQFGLDFFEDLGGMDAVKRHVESLRRRAVARLSRLRHSNGAPLVELLGRHGYAGPEAVEDVQGGIVNFRVLGSAGQLWNYRHVHDAASEAGLHIRSGCACNPGACFSYNGVSEAAALRVAESGEKTGCNDALAWIEQPAAAMEAAAAAAARETRPLGSLRASLGYLSTRADVAALADFVAGYADRTPPDVERDEVAGAEEEEEEH